MSLNIEVDAIHTDNILTTTVDSGENAGHVTTAQKWSVDVPDDGWIVPGSVVVKVSATAGATDTDWPSGDGAAIKAGTVVVTDHVSGNGTATWSSAPLASANILVRFQYFKADALRRYTAGAVPTTLRLRNDKDEAKIVVAESDDGTNWLQVGAHTVAGWEIYNFERVTQKQLKVASTSGARLIGSPISAI